MAHDAYMTPPDEASDAPQGAAHAVDEREDQTTDHAADDGSREPFREGDHVALTNQFWWSYPSVIKSRFGGQLTIARWTCSGWVVRNARGEELAAVPSAHLERVAP